MAQKIEKIFLQLEMKGFPLLKNVGKDFNNLSKGLKLTTLEVKAFAEQINNASRFKSQNEFKAQINLLKTLRSNVAMGSAAYNQLGLAIRNVASEMSNPKLGRVGTAALKEYQRRGNLGRNEALERGTGSFKGFSQRADEITKRANLAASGRNFLASSDAQLRPISNLANQISNIGLSKVDADFQRLGRSVGQVRKDILGAAKAGGKNINSLNGQKAALETLRNGVEIGSRRFKQLTKDIAAVDRQLGKLSQKQNILGGIRGLAGAAFVGGGVGFAGGLVGGVGSALTGGNFEQGTLTGGLIASQVASPIFQGISGSAEYAASLSKLKIALKDIVPDQQSYNIALAAARQATNELNVPQEVAIRGITRISAAVLGAGGNIHNATEAFLNVNAAIKATAGGAEDAKSAITAIVQIFSKGRVSAEELSGQLGERFPAAVTQFQKANSNIYKTTADLQDALKKGTVGLRELSKFITLLGDDFTETAEKIADSDEEAGARLLIQQNRLRIAIGEGLVPLGAQFQSIATEILVDLIPTIKVIAKTVVSGLDAILPLIKVLAANLKTILEITVAIGGAVIITKLSTITLTLAGLVATVKKLAASIKILNLAMLKNPIFAGAFLAIVTIQKLVKEMNKFSDAVEGLKIGDSNSANFLKDLRDDYQRQLDSVGGGTALSMMSGGLSEKERKDLKDKIDEINEIFKENLVTFDGEKVLFGAFGGDGTDKTKFGEAGALKNFKKELENGGLAMENIVVNGFTKMEDALVSFVMTGKLNFRDLANSIISDLTRMFVRAAITKPLFSALFPNLADGGVISGGELVPSAKGNAFAKNKIVPYGYGGVIKKPTTFAMKEGLGIMSEAGAEAVMPLRRTRKGRLGVEASGGGNNVVNVSVDASGSSAQGNNMKANQLGKLIGSAIQAELVKQKRPGGILYE